MVSLTNTSQLNAFSTVSAVITANTTLSAIFNSQNIYQFEPNYKARDFKGYPYLVIEVPQMENDDQYLGNITKNKEFTVDITLKMDYNAKDNLPTYASTIITALEQGNATFQNGGYHLDDVSFEGVIRDLEGQKQVVVGSFVLTLQGEVSVN